MAFPVIIPSGDYAKLAILTFIAITGQDLTFVSKSVKNKLHELFEMKGPSSKTLPPFQLALLLFYTLYSFKLLTVFKT